MSKPTKIEAPTPTTFQLKAMLAWHEKAAKAYAEYGQTENAEMASKGAARVRKTLHQTP